MNGDESHKFPLEDDLIQKRQYSEEYIIERLGDNVWSLIKVIVRKGFNVLYGHLGYGSDKEYVWGGNLFACPFLEYISNCV